MTPTATEDYTVKVYGILKEAYGDKFTHTPESFKEKLSTEPEYQQKVYGILKEGYGDRFTHTPESFTEKLALKKKEQPGILGQMKKSIERDLQKP